MVFQPLGKGVLCLVQSFQQKAHVHIFQEYKGYCFLDEESKAYTSLSERIRCTWIHYYFQVTLNDYVNEGFEPNVPSVEQRVKTFKQLSDMVGKEKVIWRFDPLIVTPEITPRTLLAKVWKVGNMLKGYTDKLVFSFVDVLAYRKVQSNLIKEIGCFTKDNVESSELTQSQKTEIVDGLVKLRDIWKEQGWNISLATCAEDLDLEQYGIEHNRCIDGELMKKLFSDDEDFIYYLNTGYLPERDMFGQLSKPHKIKDAKGMKDKGQRKVCGCMISKDIGMYNTCKHFCVYCYANTSKECVLENNKLHSDERRV